jgi:RNA polymerase sigma factor (sigma-70 family)
VAKHDPPLRSENSAQDLAGLGVNWNQTVHQHGEMLLRVAYRLLHDSADAEDVAQEVLLEAFRKQQATGAAPHPALLRRMATLRAVDRLRRRKPLETLEEHACAGRGVLPDEAAERAEQAAQIRLEISRLPPREAECFVLRYVEGLSNSEIVELIGASPSTVSTAFRQGPQETT